MDLKDVVSKEKLDEVMAKIAAVTEGRAIEKAPEPTVDAPQEPASEEPPAQPAGPITGKDVDWSEYDLDFNVKHLYPKAVLRETEQGPKWIAIVTEFYSTDRSLGNHTQRLKDGTPMNLGEFMTEQVNSPEGWKIAGLLPGSMGRAGAIFERQVPYVLPDPVELVKEVEVTAPTDEELTRVEAAASEWMTNEGLTHETEAGNVDPTEAEPAEPSAPSESGPDGIARPVSEE